MTKAKEQKTIDSLRYDVRHIRDPISANSKEWRETADQWLVTFFFDGGSFTVDYYTGSGHRKKTAYGDKAVKPDIKGVLHSIYTDSMAENENFHDWCMNYGYSDDSISALNTYKECLDQGRKLRKLGFERSYLDKLFENY